MSNQNKYCSNCGKEINKESKFCIYCGYNFEEKKVAERLNAVTERATNNKISVFSKIGKNKLIGIICAIIIVTAVYMYSSGVSIAGAYESEETFGSSYYSETLDISRRGKTTLSFYNFEDGSQYELTFNLIYSKNDDAYLVDAKKGVDLTVVYNREDLYYDSYATSEMEYLTNVANFKTSTSGGFITLSGSLTEEQARRYEIDLDDMSLSQTLNQQILLNESRVFLKR